MIWRLMVVGLAVTACGTAVSPPPNTTPPDTTQLASTTSTTSTTAAPRVEQFAFIRSIDESATRYDPAIMLSGEAAAEAARADGVIGEGEVLPNDYYISNPEEEEITANLDPDGTYVLIGLGRYGDLVDRQLSVPELVAALNGADPEAFYGIVPGQVPMILTLDGDTVVAARQQYLP
jgi:hypothetical protein